MQNNKLNRKEAYSDDLVKSTITLHNTRTRILHIRKCFPSNPIPISIRIREELELTGPYKIKKTNFRNEAFNIENIQDKLYFWDSKIKKYVPLNNSIYENIMEGNLRL